jgi:hypothetical protein
MKGYAGDDQRDTEKLQRRGYLGQDHDADDGGRGGEQGIIRAQVARASRAWRAGH